MSLPSIAVVAKEMGINLTHPIEPSKIEQILVEAMRRDLKPALDLLHAKAHEADQGNGTALWQQDPSSDIGKMLTRIHAGDVLRDIASRHFCHGKELTFINCCSGAVGQKPPQMMLRQIQSQVGPIAYADC